MKIQNVMNIISYIIFLIQKKIKSKKYHLKNLKKFLIKKTKIQEIFIFQCVYI